MTKRSLITCGGHLFLEKTMKIMARLVCGCCDAEMEFKDEASAKAAFDKAGLGHVNVTDDAGEVHESVDTFYGYWLPDEKRPGLSELFDKAFKGV